MLPVVGVADKSKLPKSTSPFSSTKSALVKVTKLPADALIVSTPAPTAVYTASVTGFVAGL